MSKLKSCPFCGSPHLDMMGYDFHKVCCSNVNCYIYGIAFIKEDWQNRTPQNEWISVDVKLPEDSSDDEGYWDCYEPYNVFCKHPTNSKMDLVTTLDWTEYGWSDEKGKDWNAYVTHYRALPLPPSKEK